MNTTALRIEILAIGIQTGSLLAILIAHQLISPEYAKKLITDYGQLVTPAALIFFALCYSLGAVVDGATAAIEQFLPFHISLTRGQPFLRIGKKPSIVRLRLEAAPALDKIMRSEFDQRLLRSTSFNLALSACAAGRLGEQALALALALTAMVSTAAWFRRRNRIHRRLIEMVDYANASPEPVEMR